MLCRHLSKVGKSQSDKLSLPFPNPKDSEGHTSYNCRHNALLHNHTIIHPFKTVEKRRKYCSVLASLQSFTQFYESEVRPLCVGGIIEVISA